MQKVLVTGANGHLGYTLVTALLQRGYAVRGSVRNPERVAQSRLFDDLDVEIVQAELSDHWQMKAAAAGMDGVFHAAAPYRYWARDAAREIVEPTLAGVRNALAASAAAGVGRFVYTSSVVAVGLEGTANAPLDESHWPARCSTPYNLAKTLAEREAWNRAEEHGLDMVAICPGGIIGPNFSRHTPTTMLFADILEGRVPGILPMSVDYVDVRDVAEAHILAYERPEAQGRYICTTRPVDCGELLALVARIRPELPLPRRGIPRLLLPVLVASDWLRQRLQGGERRITLAMIDDYFRPGQLRHFDTRRAREELGWQPRPLETSIRDTFDWIEQFGSAAEVSHA